MNNTLLIKYVAGGVTLCVALAFMQAGFENEAGLLLGGALCCLALMHIERDRNGLVATLTNPANLTLTTFALIYPASGIAHFVTKGALGGYYSVHASTVTETSTLTLKTYGLILVALLGLTLGLKWRLNRENLFAGRTIPLPRPLLIAFATGLFLIGTYATLRLAGREGDAAEKLTTVNRSIKYAEGESRLSFVGFWATWGITIGLIGLRLSDRKASPLNAPTVGAIVLSLAPMTLLYSTGARGDLASALLPLVLLLARQNTRQSNKAIVGIMLLLLASISIQTAARARSSDYSMNALQVLDWQAGRFSITAASFELVDLYGYQFGATMWTTAPMLANAMLAASGLDLRLDTGHAVTNYVGQHLAGSFNINGIVPGSIFELYFNYGAVGVLGGYWILGFLIRRASHYLSPAHRIGTRTLAAYVIALVLVWAIPMTSTLWVYFLVIRGAPLIVLFAAEHLYGGREEILRCRVFAPVERRA